MPASRPERGPGPRARLSCVVAACRSVRSWLIRPGRALAGPARRPGPSASHDARATAVPVAIRATPPLADRGTAARERPGTPSPEGTAATDVPRTHSRPLSDAPGRPG